MPSADGDIALELPKIAITLQVWSSDSINFQVKDRIIYTTLKNSVYDIKELVSRRSVGFSPLALNPRALTFIYKNREHRDHEELDQFLEQEKDPIRVRFEIIKDNIGPLDTRELFFNINLKYSTGERLVLRESLKTTIRSLKYTIVDDLKLGGVHDIITLEYNSGQELQDHDDLTIGQLLKLDTIPPYDLNIYVRTKDDFIIRLSSPNQELLRLSKVVVSLETTITAIKQFIIDQYTGGHNIDTSQIKLIYLGRVLRNEQKLREILNGDSPSITLVTLHFVINEPEPPQASGGFWSDLRNGRSLFEFLPIEPNPNFEADLERDRLLREQLNGNNETRNEPPVQPSANLPSILQAEESLYQATPPTNAALNASLREIPNKPPTFTGHELTDESYGNAINAGEEEVSVDELSISQNFYEIAINTIDGPKSVKLSSSNLIINDSDPSNPYLMLSPSGYAKLQTLGIDLQPPKVFIDSDEPEQGPVTSSLRNSTPAVSSVAYSTTIPLATAQPQSESQAQHRDLPQAGPQQRVAIPRVRRLASNIIATIRRFNGHLTSQNVTRQFRLLGKLLYQIVKISFVYTLIITPIGDNFQRYFASALLVLYLFTNQNFRSLLNELHTMLPRSARDWISRYIITAEASISSGISNLRFNTINLILDILPETEVDRTRTNIFDRIIRSFTVAVLLFFTSFEPSLHRAFLENLHLRKTRAQAAERAAREAQEQEAQQQEESPGYVLGTDDNNDEELLGDDDNNATGVQVHHAN